MVTWAIPIKLLAGECRERDSWDVCDGSGNGLWPPGNKPLPWHNIDSDPCRRMESLGYNDTYRLHWQIQLNQETHFRFRESHLNRAITWQFQRRKIKHTYFILTLCNLFQLPMTKQFCVEKIPRTKGQWRGKSFHLMTSSWFYGS